MAHTRGQVEFRHLAWKEDKGEKISVDTNDPDSEKCFNFNKILNKNSQKYFIVYCLLMFQNEKPKNTTTTNFCTKMYDLSIKFTFSNEGHGQNYISSEKCRSNKNKNGGYLTTLTLYLVDNGGYRDRSWE